MGKKVSARVHAEKINNSEKYMMNQDVQNLGTPGTRSQRTGCPGYSVHLQVETGCPGSEDRVPGGSYQPRPGARDSYRRPRDPQIWGTNQVSISYLPPTT